MSKLKELRDQRGKLVHDMRAMLDKVEAEKRGLTSDEQSQYDTLFNEQARVAQQIQTEERQAELDREMAARTATGQAEDKSSRQEQRHNPRGSEEYRAAFDRFLRGGMSALAGDEIRALQAGADPEGGYLVAPEQFVAGLLKALDNQVFIRSRATKHQVANAAGLGVITLASDVDDADWTAELKTGNEDAGLGFGKRELRPNPLAKRIKISNKLLRAALMNPEAMVMERLAYKFAVTQEKAFLTGHGSKQPLGLFTASGDGISTSRDIADGNTATAITFDGLIAAKYGLKGGYHAQAEWLFHRDALKQISQIKDANGQYIWRESVRAGEPDRILNLPIMMSEYVPNTFTTGNYVGMLGDFSHYWIADAMDMQVQVLRELYAESNQTGYIGRLESDGQPALEEAFVRIKLA